MRTLRPLLLLSLLFAVAPAFAQPGNVRNFIFKQYQVGPPVIPVDYGFEECTADGVFAYPTSSNRPDCHELASGLILSSGTLSIDWSVAAMVSDLIDYALTTDVDAVAADLDALAISTASDLSTGLAGKANASHDHPATGISDSTTVGRSVLTAANAAAARTAIGAGTGSSNFDGAYGSLTGTPSVFAPDTHTHPLADCSDCTATGKAVMGVASYAALRGAVMDTQTHLADGATNAADNAPVALTGSTVGDLETELNATNAMYNDLATKYNALAGIVNALIDAGEANAILTP